jgi:hypothetical protein
LYGIKPAIIAIILAIYPLWNLKNETAGIHCVRR